MFRYNFREGTSAEATEKNAILGPSEPGVETDTGKFKIGNGYTRWNDLPYFLNEDGVAALIQDAISGVSGSSLQEHINSLIPHPIYDDGPSLELLYENSKV